MKGRWILWLPEELAWIEQRKDMPRRDLHAMFCARFDRESISLETFKGMCKRKGFMTGRTGCFTAGQAAYNKGGKMPFNANSAATWFKKGSIPPNVRGLGHERMTRDGYVEISVDEVNPWTGHSRRYAQKHRHLWEQVNGPVPHGMRLKCLDGNRANTDPSNWDAIPYALAPRLNGKYGRGYDKAEQELRPTIMAIAKLEHAARSSRKTSKAQK